MLRTLVITVYCIFMDMTWMWYKVGVKRYTKHTQSKGQKVYCTVGNLFLSHRTSSGSTRSSSCVFDDLCTLEDVMVMSFFSSTMIPTFLMLIRSECFGKRCCVKTGGDINKTGPCSGKVQQQMCSGLLEEAASCRQLSVRKSAFYRQWYFIDTT